MIESVIKFTNQLDAAARLLEILPKKELVERKTLIICPSFDSVILVDEIARELNLSYEMLFCENISAPNNAECDIASVSEIEEIVINDELVRAFGISYDFIYGEAHRKYEEILKQIYKFRKGEQIKSLQSRNVLLIDEGCETGLTAMICVKTLIKLGAKTISYATPLIAADVAVSLGDLVDEIYTTQKIVNFIDVDSYYDEKIPVTNELIMSILLDSPKYLPLQKEQGEEDAI